MYNVVHTVIFKIHYSYVTVSHIKIQMCLFQMNLVNHTSVNFIVPNFTPLFLYLPPPWFTT